MDLRSIVLYLRLKGINGSEIYDNLVTMLPDNALAYSTMTLWLRQERLPQPSEPDHNLTGDPHVDETDQGVLSTLTIQPFGSLRDIGWLTCLSYSTVHSHLTRSRGSRIRHLRWIPHVLTSEQKVNRVRDSQVWLRMLQAQQSDPGMTLSCPTDRECHTIESPKFMLTEVWGVTGFHAVKWFNLLFGCFDFNCLNFPLQNYSFTGVWITVGRMRGGVPNWSKMSECEIADLGQGVFCAQESRALTLLRQQYPTDLSRRSLYPLAIVVSTLAHVRLNVNWHEGPNSLLNGLMIITK
jgi:hypothetical protein